MSKGISLLSFSHMHPGSFSPNKGYQKSKKQKDKKKTHNKNATINDNSSASSGINLGFKTAHNGEHSRVRVSLRWGYHKGMKEKPLLREIWTAQIHHQKQHLGISGVVSRKTYKTSFLPP